MSKKLTILLIILLLIPPVISYDVVGTCTRADVWGCIGWLDCGYGSCSSVNVCPAHSHVSTSETTCSGGGRGCGAFGLFCCSYSGSTYCDCDNNYGDCDNTDSNGCEQNLLSSESDCGSCGNTCTDAPCTSGSCEADSSWSQCQVGCWGGVVTQPQFAGLFWPDIYGTSGCESTYEDINCGWGGYDQGYCKCDSNHLDCNQGTDGCESLKSNIRTCGDCDNNCILQGCTGSEYLTYTSENNILSICDVQCNDYACDVKTKDTGYCSNNNDCRNYETGSSYCQPDTDSEGWCCPPDTCGHDGECYTEYEEFVENDQLYVCKLINTKMVWTEVDLRMSLSKLIEYERSIDTVEENETLYFSNTGLSNECINSNYSQCITGSPHYAYQYCSSISSIFDGMFNLELNRNVPVLVSEQSLYNPYEGVVDVVSLNDCSNSATDEAHLKC